MTTNLTLNQQAGNIPLFLETDNVLVNVGSSAITLLNVGANSANVTLAAGARFEVPPNVTSIQFTQPFGNSTIIQILSFNKGVTIRDETYRKETDATYNYHAFAQPGSSTASAVWKVFRENRTTGAIDYANGNEGYENLGSGFAGMTYA
jgi:hypothetical protein